MNCRTLSFPDSFFLEENRSGYTVSKEQKRIWAVELDLLAKLQLVCEKYDFRYSVDEGTLLGTIRHGGFIPWDDDIDVCMLREDYNKLCRVAATEFCHPYFFQTEQTNPGSVRGHAQIRNNTTTGILNTELEHHYLFNQGIFIDIFPLDAVPDDKDDLSHFVKKADFLRRIARAYARRSTRVCKTELKRLKVSIPYYFVGKWFKKNVFYQIYERFIQRYNTCDCQRLANMFLPDLKPSFIYDKQWFRDSIEMPFEMLTVHVHVGYLDYLRRHYGNWETPIQGGSIHGGVVFDTEISYTDYFKSYTVE